MTSTTTHVSTAGRGTRFSWSNITTVATLSVISPAKIDLFMGYKWVIYSICASDFHQHRIRNNKNKNMIFTIIFEQLYISNQWIKTYQTFKDNFKGLLVTTVATLSVISPAKIGVLRSLGEDMEGLVDALLCNTIGSVYSYVFKKAGLYTI